MQVVSSQHVSSLDYLVHEFSHRSHLINTYGQSYEFDLYKYVFRGYVSKETVKLRRWGVLQDNLVLSTELIMRIGHRKEIRKLTFRVLAIRSDEGLTLETSAFESLYGGQFTLSIQLTKPNYGFILRVIFGNFLKIVRLLSATQCVK